MKNLILACVLGLASAVGAQAQPCIDGFKSSGNFLSGSKYSTQVTLPGVTAAQAFGRVQRFTADNGFTVQSADPKTGEIHAAQSALLAKGKRVPLDITVRDEAGGTAIALHYATSPGQMSPEGAIKDHFCKTVAAAATAAEHAPAPVPPPVAAAATAAPVPRPAIPDSEFIKNGQPCMSGLCIGDTIAQLPKSITWEPYLPGGGERKHVQPSASAVDGLTKPFKGPRRALERVATALSSGAFTGEELQALSELQAVCAVLHRQQLVAYFKSASGHPTSVYFAPGLNAAGQLEFRVTQMMRLYKSAISLDQQNDVRAAAAEQYRPFLEAQAAARLNDRSNLASVGINRGPPVSVGLVESTWVRDANEQPVLKHPACGGAVPVKLD